MHSYHHIYTVKAPSSNNVKIRDPREMPSSVSTWLLTQRFMQPLALSLHLQACMSVCLDPSNFSFSRSRNLEEEKTPAGPLVWHLGKDSRGPFIYSVTEFSMLNKFCCLVTAVLYVVHCLSNALDPYLLL